MIKFENNRVNCEQEGLQDICMRIADYDGDGERIMRANIQLDGGWVNVDCHSVKMLTEMLREYKADVQIQYWRAMRDRKFFLGTFGKFAKKVSSPV